MKKIVRLTEKDLSRLVKKVINEGVEVIHTPEQLIKNLESQPNKSATIYVEDKSLKVKYSNGSIVGLECENTPVIKEQSEDTSFLDGIVKELIKEGFKVVDKISLPDGEYDLSGWGYTCYLNKNNKKTGFVYVTTGGIRGSWENKKVNVVGGKIQKNEFGEVYKMLYNKTEVGQSSDL